MKSLVHRVLAQHADPRVTIEEIDISTDRALLDRYGLEIPVLAIDGKKMAKYRVSEQELMRMIDARPGQDKG